MSRNRSPLLVYTLPVLIVSGLFITPGCTPKPRGYLGATVMTVDLETAQAFDLWLHASQLGVTNGALVAQVERDGPAAQAGLKEGDVIVQVDRRQVKSPRDLVNYLKKQRPSGEVALTVDRAGNRYVFQMRLAPRP